MEFRIEPPSWPSHALEPVISRRTVDLHVDRLHRGYLDQLEGLIGGEPESRLALEDVVRVAEGAIFENAAQVWNHDFYWRSLRPEGGGAPRGALADEIQESFGCFDKFGDELVERGAGHFGSGWLWLVRWRGSLRIETTSDADNPIARGWVPLLGLDLWEHAYFLDYEERRRSHLEAVLDRLVDWEFAARNLAGDLVADPGPPPGAR